VNFFRQLMQKPWTAVPATPGNLLQGREFSLPTVTVGLRVFLGVVTVVFTLLVVSYFGRMAFADWRALPEPWLLWLNTGSLIASSLAFQAALVAARRAQRVRIRDGLATGGIFALAFLVGQFLVWQQLVALGYFAQENPANAFFYVITGLHALHLLGGLVAWGRTTAKLLRGVALDQLRLSVELCTVYWHFLLLIWLALFALLIFT
jgi:cytochrome c oxidase subunit 3